ncbi:hypothetical protein GGX14DRAFT_601059 [Mycena pura]|uniref:Uncharacterized protein n=1 Tax=Mycena pura TaxID=153505 RepID=A0AAD6Y4H4_9AGAR|nr:hypothetical protein GGX14DRAFT_601059 [Mycena pura]
MLPLFKKLFAYLVNDEPEPQSSPLRPPPPPVPNHATRPQRQAMPQNFAPPPGPQAGAQHAYHHGYYQQPAMYPTAPQAYAAPPPMYPAYGYSAHGYCFQQPLPPSPAFFPWQPPFVPYPYPNPYPPGPPALHHVPVASSKENLPAVPAPSQQYSESPLWCEGCNQFAVGGDNVDAEVVDYNAEEVQFTCQECRGTGRVIKALCGLKYSIILFPDPGATSNTRDLKHFPAVFVRRDAASMGTSGEYIFHWAQCTEDDSSTPLIFGRDRKACWDAVSTYRKLKPNQIAIVRLPKYMDPEPDVHKNATLERTFRCAFPSIAKIMTNFHDHPVVLDFVASSARTAIEIELEAVIEDVTPSLFYQHGLEVLSMPEQQWRMSSVGFALFQMLSVQLDLRLGEPLNLNGDLLDDLKNQRVISRMAADECALMAMWEWSSARADCDVMDLNNLKKKSSFIQKHVNYVRTYRPPAFHRIAPFPPNVKPRPPIIVPNEPAKPMRPRPRPAYNWMADPEEDATRKLAETKKRGRAVRFDNEGSGSDWQPDPEEESENRVSKKRKSAVQVAEVEPPRRRSTRLNK